MEYNIRPDYQTHRLLQEYGAPKTGWSSRTGHHGRHKWRDQQGPNPLMMMGLDRS